MPSPTKTERRAPSAISPTHGAPSGLGHASKEMLSVHAANAHGESGPRARAANECAPRDPEQRERQVEGRYSEGAEQMATYETVTCFHLT